MSHRPLARRLATTAAAFALLGTVFTLGAKPVSAAGYGNCSTHAHWIAGSQAPVVVQGVQSYIDATSASSLCTNPGGIQDNGIYQHVLIGEGDGGPGILSIGIVTCDVPVTTGCDWVGRVQPHYWINNVECDWPNNDDQFDLGNADWAQHQYRIWFDTANNTWYLYIDNIVKKTVFATGVFACLNPNTANYAAGGWFSERWDLGDGWGNANNWTQFTTMQWRNASGWVSPSYTVNSNCALNNHAGTPHSQQCWYSPNGQSQRTDTIY